MPTQSARAKANRQKAAEAFGRMIRRWRELNGWSQYVAEKWAEAAGFCSLSLCEILRSLVREECSRRGDRLIRCIDSLDEAAPATHLLLLQDVLIGETTYTPKQLQQLWDGAQWLPQQWLESWTAGPKRLMPAGGGA